MSRSTTDETPAENRTQVVAAGGSATFTIPLVVSVRIGQPTPWTGSDVAGAQDRTQGVMAGEKVSIDPHYANREGYDPEFLGHGRLAVPLPKLSSRLEADAARLLRPEAGASPFELRYHHFSVVMNRPRRLAFFTAVNIDGRTAQSPRREQDAWFFDPRLPADAQVGNDLYDNNPFDRGHLVRRLDPAWGRTAPIAKVANDDTFHFTNCSPQHARFNQGKNLWAGLEDFLLDRASDARKRLTVFTGPVFADDDPVYRGVKIPRKFWKVAATVRPNGALAALAFVVDQSRLLDSILAEGTATQVAETFQVKVKSVEALTGLNFGTLRAREAPSVGGFGQEAAGGQPLGSFDDIALFDGEPVPDDGGVVTIPESFAVGGSPAGGPGPEYHLVAYDDDGAERTDGPGGRVSDRLEQIVKAGGLTDVIVFSHGWQGDVPAAHAQYRNWVATMASCEADRARARQVRPGFRPLLIGIHWPSLPWGDESLGSNPSFAVGSDPTEALVRDFAGRLGNPPGIEEPLRVVLSAVGSGGSPSRLPDEVRAAYEEIDRLVGPPPAGPGAPPGAEGDGFDPEGIYAEARREDPGPSSTSFGFGGAIRDALLSPLRATSFRRMKDLGRRVGEGAVHALLARLLRTSDPEVRFHLMGHSFGCIVCSGAIAGPIGGVALKRPVHSLSLIQGALSLWSYAEDIPFARGTPGYYRRVVTEHRVAGPILTTQSSFDTAVGTWYPRASRMLGQVAFQAEYPKYGGVGTFGIRGAGASVIDLHLGAADANDRFDAGKIYNIDASNVVRTGGWPSGAHSDLNHKELAHAVWSAILSS